jgi:hypothetical protein
MDLPARIAAQRQRIERLETALWAGGFDVSLLEPYQEAFRELEDMIGSCGAERRHRFVLVIPVADSPRHLTACLESLLSLCRAFGYGGIERGRYRRVAVLLADDSADSEMTRRNRDIAARLDAAGIDIEYFGIEEQWALLQRLADAQLGTIVGEHRPDGFARKGQAMTRNIAYLRLAEMQARLDDGRGQQRLLFYTIDADQTFGVDVQTAEGPRSVQALNYFYWIDRLFDTGSVEVMTGKVVGDPPVSPAVMTGNFLEDVLCFLRGMSGLDPGAAYRQPSDDTLRADDAAYHDMAQLFGFTGQSAAYHYRCRKKGEPSNVDCFIEFARQLNSFLHGEHPTRATWFRYQSAPTSLHPARTVYTGNYVFNAVALRWFIPFAPLRLRMSGPTLGRMLKAALGAGFAAVNLPMQHRRTLTLTRESEFRPGVLSSDAGTDMTDEMERQFYGDVMLFSVERLSVQGYPGRAVERAQGARVLDAVHAELSETYRERRALIAIRLDALRALLDGSAAWWNRCDALDGAMQDFANFVENIAFNFGIGSSQPAPFEDSASWPAWRAHLLDAMVGLPADHQAWRAALTILRRDGPA